MIPIKPSDVTWTDEQWSAIYEDNKNIIVSAGAGSGKTAVLTERVIRKLKDGVNVNELLILTFTKAAAGEMADRIRKKIKKLPELSEQLNLLDSSYITTFDSFSLSVVKKYHYLINVSPNIGIIEESIINAKKEEIMEDIFENLYKERNTKFLKLIKNYCIKDDKELKKYIISISNKLDMLSNKNEYLNSYIDNHLNNEKIEKDIEKYIEIIKEKIELIKYNIEEISYLDNDYATKLSDSISSLIDSNNYDELYQSLEKIKLPQVPRGSDEAIKTLKKEISDIKDNMKKQCCYKSEEEIKKTIISTQETIEIIIDIILKLTKKIQDYKYENDSYEFNDIAIMAINILKNNISVRNEMKNFFKEIMIDEYQDTNDLQEEFVSMIENNNVYMVGDIKQSIYRFRNANPYIFKNKYDTYSKEDNPSLKIDLNKNFRSRSEVLKNINDIFDLIMDDVIGGANYIESHRMIFGNKSYLKEDTHHNNNMDIYSYKYDKDKGFSKEEIEAFICGNDILNKLKENYLVMDKETGTLRNMKYSDVCLIMDRASSFELYKKIFSYLHIPLTLYKDDSMNNDNDILVINNIIRLIIKIHDKEYDTLFKYLFTSIERSFINKEDDNKIFEYFANNTFKDTMLYKNLEEISSNIDSISISELIEKIIEKLDYYDKIITISNIKNSIVKLDKIKDIALNMEKLGYDIKEFSEYLNKMIEEEIDIKYSSSSISSNSVKIMTIHKSKGLEYPLCYYTGIYKKFNISDLKEEYIYDKKYGIIVPYFCEGIGTTIYKELLRDTYIKEEISEKIRLFYVALTRAREKMIIINPANEEYEENIYITIPKRIKEKYRSLKDIVDSVYSSSKELYKIIDLEKENLTKDYALVTVANYKDYLNKYITEVKNVQEIKIENDRIVQESFSKKTNKLIDEKEKELMELGTKIHEILELTNLVNPNYNMIKNNFFKEKIKKFIKSDILKDINKAKIYKEYEFIYEKENVEYHGIIDLMLEYYTHIDIIDYKLKNIEDKNYKKQLEGYKEYIENISGKKTNIYLYSILDEKINKVN